MPDVTSPAATADRRTAVSRLADALAVIDEAASAGQATHPAGCIALTGYYDDEPTRLFWYGRGGCDYTHPRTQRGLRVQYARRGWERGTTPTAAASNDDASNNDASNNDAGSAAAATD